MTRALEAANLHVRLRSQQVLDGLDLALRPGQVKALVGMNGAGKTTALRVFLGMLRPAAEHVRIHGHDIASGSRELWRRVGHLIETPSCYPELTARENIATTARLHGADPR